MMKSIILNLLLILISTSSYCQSLTERKIYKLLLSQEKELMTKEIKALGFTYSTSKNINGVKSDIYVKSNNGNDLEIVEFSFNDEMFCLQYKPTSNYYTTYKDILLTSKYKYSYSQNDDKFYDWKGLRIGINDKLKIMSIFIALKKYLPKELTEDVIINSKN